MRNWLLFEEPAQVLIPGGAHVVVLLGVVLWWSVLGRGRKSVSGRKRALLIALFAWSWVVMMPYTVHSMLRHWEGPRVPVVIGDARPGLPVLVLTAGDVVADREGDYRVQLSGSSWSRTEAGIELWRTMGGTLIFAGGLPGPGAESVAAAMASRAEALGVPPASIVVEEASFNTHQSISDFFQNTGSTEIWLVTSALHMPRALAVARSLGIDARPWPCDYQAREKIGMAGWLPHNSVAQLWTPLLHEWVGFAYYRFRGYIRNPALPDKIDG
jgi:uncharacterized SAM-binding protein YcdF (DUF218 family)